MHRLRFLQLPAHSHTVALASMAAFGTQVVFALLMLRLFSPQAVGEFSLLSQIGFFWMTLALAQAPLSLLANAGVPAHQALRAAWRSSLLRGVWLLPVAALAVWLSGLATLSALVWVLLLAASQMAWTLAQSFTLRVGTRWQQAAVRVVPPLTAALAALCGAWLDASGPTLVASAVLGYAVGAVWLLPAWRPAQLVAPSDAFTPSGKLQQATDPRQQIRRDLEDDLAQAQADARAEALPHVVSAQQSDPRSARLRFAHTLCDALLATSVVVVWQRLYGAQDTGWLTALLRVLGFVPALVHMAWAQVVLAQGEATPPTHTTALGAASPGVVPGVAADAPQPHTRARHAPRMAWLMGLGAAACVAALAGGCALALDGDWLDARWSGVLAYLLPVAVWQAAACVLAAFSHRPFQTQAAVRYSWACIALTGVQALVLWWPVVIGTSIDATQHITAFASVSGLGLLALSVWLARLR